MPLRCCLQRLVNAVLLVWETPLLESAVVLSTRSDKGSASMNLPKIETITFEPAKGSHISEAMRGAIALAMEHQCIAEFGFNEKWYRVQYENLMEQVKPDESQ